MSEHTYVIKFEGTSLADANRYADDLRDALLDVSPEIRVAVKRDDPSTMDFGGTLVVVLGTSAVIAIAKGIQSWLQRRDTATITIETPNGKAIAQNISGRNAVRLAELLTHKA
jgi:Effector Associated Constant Component 1